MLFMHVMFCNRIINDVATLMKIVKMCRASVQNVNYIHRKVPYNALYQNLTNIFAPPK